jgi:hypothetical protein
MLARGTEDKEHAMSQKLNSVIAVIGIDIGKNSFHLVGQDRVEFWRCGKSGAQSCTQAPLLPSSTAEVASLTPIIFFTPTISKHSDN